MILPNQFVVLEKMKENAFIPLQIVEYTRIAFEKYNDTTVNNENRYLEVLTAKPDAVIRDMAMVIHLASKATAISPEALVREFGFSMADHDRNRIESWLAEIRIVNYLTEIGFVSIHHNGTRKSKSADFIAERHGVKFAIEVTSLSYYIMSGKWRLDSIENIITSKIFSDGKLIQLDNSVKEEGCEQTFLCIVINNLDMLALNTSEDYLEICKNICNDLELPDTLHVGIITGSSFNAIYPPL